MSNPARGHKVEKHHPSGKKNATFSPYEKETATVYNIGKSGISKKKKKHTDSCYRTTCGCRAHAYRRTIERRVADSMNEKRRKRNKKTAKKHDARKRQYGIGKPKTPGGYKFAPLVANQLWRLNQHEHAYFGLSSPWLFPSRSVILLPAVVQPWIFLQRSISP